MIVYLLDASVVAEMYKPESAHGGQAEYRRNQAMLARLTSQSLTGDATLFIPCFCVCEVKNTLAKWHLREKRITLNEYKEATSTFIDSVHDRKIFYSYDYTRYHNIAADSVIEVEQRTALEPHRGPLSTFDIVLIAMGLELFRVFRRKVEVLTRDRRLAKIAGNFAKTMRVHYWDDLTVARLPTV